MRSGQPSEDAEQPPEAAPEHDEPTRRRPTVDEMSEWSFPASDPPATWTWDVGGESHVANT